jgi:site-specific recombinase XerD
MSALSTLFEQFLRERRYLKNATPKTEAWYQSAFDALTRTVPIATPADLNKAALTSFILSLRQRGLCPVSCNTWAKALNAFFTRLHVEGHVAECLRIQPQRTEKRILQTLSEEQLRRLVTFKPKTMAQWRAYALACTMTDTGIRIEEAFGLRQGDVDYDNLLVKVRGKGRKERLVPFFVRAAPRALSVATASCTGAMAGDWNS